MVGILGAMRRLSVAATETLECLLGTTPHGGAGHLGCGHELHIGNDNVASDGLDQANLDHGNIVDKSVADLDDPQLDVHQLELLLLVLGPGQNRQAVSQSALRGASACSHDIGSQIATPRVGMGIQLKAVDHQSRAILDGKIQLQMGISAAALSAGNVEALSKRFGGQLEGLGLDGERLEDVLVRFGYLGNDCKGSGRRRQGKLLEKHGGEDRVVAMQKRREQ